MIFYLFDKKIMLFIIKIYVFNKNRFKLKKSDLNQICLLNPIFFNLKKEIMIFLQPCFAERDIPHKSVFNA